MIWIHGGGWMGGDPTAMNMHMKYSAMRGAVGFSLQYRLMTSAHYSDNKKLSKDENDKRRAAKRQEFIDGPSVRDLIDDVEDAVRYIRKNAETLGIDPQKLVAIGDSAGAHLTSSLGTIAEKDARVNIAIPCSSISDLTTGFGPDYIKPSPGFEGKEMKDDPDRLKRGKGLSPLFNIKGDVSFLVLAGAKDWLKDEPDNFYKALKEAGVDVEFKKYPFSRHAFIVYGYSAAIEEITETLLDIDAFLVKRKFIEGKSPLKYPAEIKSTVALPEFTKAFSDEKTFESDKDFPPFFTASMMVKLPKRYSGTLFRLEGSFGCTYNINDRGHDFSALKIRQRGGQIKIPGETWVNVSISLSPEKVIIKAGDQSTEIKNTVKQSFLSKKIIINKGLKAEIKDLKFARN